MSPCTILPPVESGAFAWSKKLKPDAVERRWNVVCYILIDAQRPGERDGEIVLERGACVGESSVEGQEGHHRLSAPAKTALHRCLAVKSVTGVDYRAQSTIFSWLARHYASRGGP